MKKQIKSFFSGAVVATVLISSVSTVLAKTGTQSINVTYKNIKMYLNGKQISSPAEPFIVNGTTFVPLRVVSESLGVETNWDGNTNSIYMGNTVSGTAYSLTDMAPIQGTWKFNNKDNLKGIGFENRNDKTSKPVVYDLKGEYNKFTGTFTNSSSGGGTYSMQVYGDGRLLYESPTPIERGNEIPVELDIKGVNKLQFVAKFEHFSTGLDIYSDVIIKEPTLWK